MPLKKAKWLSKTLLLCSSSRAKLSAEQADRLKAGTNAARILDMLLSLPNQEARILALPDCFTPPAPTSAAEVPDDEASTEELWCSPSQMLSELEIRIRLVTGGTQDNMAMARVSLLASGNDTMPTGTQLMDVLIELREGIKQTWLDGMS